MNILQHTWSATKWSLAGIVAAYKTQIAFRLEVGLVTVLTLAAFWIARDVNQLLWLLFSAHLILIIELINSAIEAAVDRIGPERNKLSRIAKDSGSAAVFYALLFMLVVWGLIIGTNIHNY